jgi:gas vesicle structural protein
MQRHDSNELYLSDLLDRLLDTGVVLRGHITISVAQIDLIYLDISVVLASVERSLKWLRVSEDKAEEAKNVERSRLH